MPVAARVDAGRAVASLPRLLRQVEHAVSERFAQALQAQGLSLEEFDALELVFDGQGHTMAEVMDVTLLPAASTTRLVDRLVARNYVYRSVDELDRRRVLVFLAPRGRKLFVKLELEQSRIGAELAEEWGAGGSDDAVQLATALQRVQQRIAQSAAPE